MIQELSKLPDGLVAVKQWGGVRLFKTLLKDCEAMAESLFGVLDIWAASSDFVDELVEDALPELLE